MCFFRFKVGCRRRRHRRCRHKCERSNLSFLSYSFSHFTSYHVRYLGFYHVPHTIRFEKYHTKKNRMEIFYAELKKEKVQKRPRRVTHRIYTSKTPTMLLDTSACWHIFSFFLFSRILMSLAMTIFWFLFLVPFKMTEKNEQFGCCSFDHKFHYAF